jgi:hypothetical protein
MEGMGNVQANPPLKFGYNQIWISIAKIGSQVFLFLTRR